MILRNKYREKFEKSKCFGFVADEDREILHNQTEGGVNKQQTKYERVKIKTEFLKEELKKYSDRLAELHGQIVKYEEKKNYKSVICFYKSIDDISDDY